MQQHLAVELPVVLRGCSASQERPVLPPLVPWSGTFAYRTPLPSGPARGPPAIHMDTFASPQHVALTPSWGGRWRLWAVPRHLVPVPEDVGGRGWAA